MEVTNRFKGLDLIDRAPEELWMEVLDTVQEAVIKTIPKKKKCKKAKWLSEVTDTNQGNPGFPAATRERLQESFFNAS